MFAARKRPSVQFAARERGIGNYTTIPSASAGLSLSPSSSKDIILVPLKIFGSFL